jgi:hypothetical protein
MVLSLDNTPTAHDTLPLLEVAADRDPDGEEEEGEQDSHYKPFRIILILIRGLLREIFNRGRRGRIPTVNMIIMVLLHEFSNLRRRGNSHKHQFCLIYVFIKGRCMRF